ncbi:MAG: flagellar biosynthetic protein FliO, partial [Candidatus Didemnitutus sp.]|nr:flagellar biosynthetic protein FliO [Candidatus Didemnitutus sp.]
LPRFSRLACLAGALFLSAGVRAEEKAAEADLIYPRTAATPELPAAAGKPGGSKNTIMLLAAAAAGIGGWMLWRQRKGPSGAGGLARKLAIAESRSLGNRQFLVVADYDGRKFLLGVCPGRIEMLTPLDERKAGNPTQ